MAQNLSDNIKAAAAEIVTRGKLLIFTGAGISVESGIPPFRGEGGLWNSVNPDFCEIDYFTTHPKDAWIMHKRCFYESYGRAKPNPAHFACAQLQQSGLAFALVTQNIDGLHQAAGSPDVIEFHGALHHLSCMRCGASFPATSDILSPDVPRCPKCKGLLKPDIVFFGEGIPEDASTRAFEGAENAASVLICGTAGEVMPACHIPYLAKRRGALIVEVNPAPSAFSDSITDYHLKGKAASVLPELLSAISKISPQH